MSIYKPSTKYKVAYTADGKAFGIFNKLAEAIEKKRRMNNRGKAVRVYEWYEDQSIWHWRV